MLHRIFPFQPSKTEFKLFVLYTLLVIYGSLYPFNFQLQALFRDLNPHILELHLRNLGDMGINLALCMPFGFLGVRAMRSPFQPLVYCCIVTLLSVPLAFGLQFLQIMIPSRVPSLMDSLLNILGCALAAYIGVVHRFRFFWGKRGLEHWKSIPLLLALCWLGYLLAPFIPSLDFGVIKDSLKPLLLRPEFLFIPFLLHITGWTLFAYTLSEYMNQSLKPWQHALIMIAASCAQIPIVEKTITLSQVTGNLGALILWPLLRHRSDQAQIKVLFALLLLTVSLRGLAPFDFSHSLHIDFHWLPFFGFLEGNMLIDVHMVFLKVFFYGLIIFFLERAGASSKKAVLLCLVWITLIEIAQLWYLRHTPETTDMIIVLGTALMIKIFKQSQATQPLSYHGPERRNAGAR